MRGNHKEANPKHRNLHSSQLPPHHPPTARIHTQSATQMYACRAAVDLSLSIIHRGRSMRIRNRRSWSAAMHWLLPAGSLMTLRKSLKRPRTKAYKAAARSIHACVKPARCNTTQPHATAAGILTLPSTINCKPRFSVECMLQKMRLAYKSHQTRLCYQCHRCSVCSNT